MRPLITANCGCSVAGRGGARTGPRRYRGHPACRHHASVPRSSPARQHGAEMTRQRAASYSSSTLSSTSSADSAATYASIKSVTSSSCASRASSSQSSNFWNKFDRKTKTYSVLSVLKGLFKHKERGEPSKLSSQNLQIFHISPVSQQLETSFTRQSLRRPAAALATPPSPLSSTACPAGLYCVIEDFLTEYDLRLEEEEERAEMIARKSKQLQ